MCSAKRSGDKPVPLSTPGATVCWQGGRALSKQVSQHLCSFAGLDLLVKLVVRGNL